MPLSFCEINKDYVHKSISSIALLTKHISNIETFMSRDYDNSTSSTDLREGNVNFGSQQKTLQFVVNSYIPSGLRRDWVSRWQNQVREEIFHFSMDRKETGRQEKAQQKVT